jgi:hypothetical protein
MPKDNIEHPAHYTALEGKPEVWDWIDLGMDYHEYCGYLQGNILKYLRRYKYKNGKEDLQKAEAYLKKLMDVTSGN